MPPTRIAQTEPSRLAWWPSYLGRRWSESLENRRFRPPSPPALGGELDRLRRAILADPSDDRARLAFADALALIGGADRAEFIRSQILSADDVGGPGPERSAREDRERSLLLANGPDWLSELGPWAVRDPVFRRGFVESVTLTGRCFVSLGEGLFGTAPVREPRLVAAAALLDELCRTPWLARAGSLDLTGNRLGDSGLRALVGSPHFAATARLGLSANDLTRVPDLPAIERLDLSANPLPGSALRALGRMRLTELDLSHVPLTPAELASGSSCGPRHLRAAGCGLARLPSLPEGLISLDLRDNFLARADFESPELGSLDLSHNRLDDDGLGLRNLPGLRRLGLAGNRLGCAAIGRLGTISTPELWELDLGSNRIGDDELSLLGRAVGLAGHCKLGLADNRFTEEGLVRFLADLGISPHTLALGWNPIGDTTAVELAAGAAGAELRVLDMSGTRIGWRGADALARSPHLDRLHTLILRDCPRLHADGLGRLRERFGNGLTVAETPES